MMSYGYHVTLGLTADDDGLTAPHGLHFSVGLVSWREKRKFSTDLIQPVVSNNIAQFVHVKIDIHILQDNLNMAVCTTHIRTYTYSIKGVICTQINSTSALQSKTLSCTH